MLSKKDYLNLVLFFLLTLALSFLFFLNVERDKRQVRFQDLKASFKLITDLTGNTVSAGYCQWTEFYRAVKENDSAFIESIYEEITDTFPYIGSIEIIDGKPLFPDKYYKVQDLGSSIYIDYKIYNDFSTECIKKAFLRVTVSDEQILSDIQIVKNFTFIPSKNRFGSLMNKDIYYTGKQLLWNQIAASLLISILASFVYYMRIYSRLRFFYESRGLEKIISIFEHTERYSANHSKNVAIIAYEIGVKAGIKGKALKDLKIAALLHDIGKISIPKSILNKNGKLTEEEFDIVKKHPVYSAEIIGNFEELSHLTEYIKYHHEKMDGSGYPSHLRGDEIPRLSRVIAVADIFEALIGERPYRTPLNPMEALKLMNNEMSLDQEILECLNTNYLEICDKIHLSHWEKTFTPKRSPYYLGEMEPS